jgi:hypothetical protein
MAFEGSYPTGRAARSTANDEVSGWAVGITFFAAIMLLLIGSFHMMTGFVAILDDSFFQVRPGYALQIDTTTWGWIHLVGGGLAMIVGGLLITGNVIARIAAIAIAVISAIGNFWSIPYYPVWSILMLAFDIAVIWAVTTYGRYVNDS